MSITNRQEQQRLSRGHRTLVCGSMDDIRCFAVPYSREQMITTRYTEDEHGMLCGEYIRFFAEIDSAESADWLFVFDSPYACFNTNIPRERRILFLMEPPGVTVYPLHYLEQFGIVVSPYEIPRYSGRLIRTNPCLGWFVGERYFRTLGDVLGYGIPQKTKLISMVTSLKRRIPGRKKRLALMEAVRSSFGDEFGCFGREFAPVDDKLDAIAPYKYHIAIENSRLPNYWTEKLADAWIGWALPIYCGDPTILDQIPDPRGIELIDTDDIEGAVRKIAALIEADPFEERLGAIKKCREWVIERANPYRRVCELIESADEDVKSAPRLDRSQSIHVVTKGKTELLYRLVNAACGHNAADRVFCAYCRMKGRVW